MKDKQKPSRAGVLHQVIEEILSRKDGQIPTDIEGIDVLFDGIDDLANALLLRWHTRLVASLERGLADEPEDREEAVIEAWRHAAWIYWGVRKVIDDLADHPPTKKLLTRSARPHTTTGQPWLSRPGWPAATTNQQFESATDSNSKRDDAIS